MSNDLVVATQALAKEQAESVLKRIQLLRITDVVTYQLAVDLLRSAKKILTTLESKFEPSVKAAYDSHRKAVHLRDEALGGFEEAERLGKQKIALYAQDNPNAPAIPGLVLSERWVAEVTDPELVPEDYKKVDMDKVKGVAQALKEQTRIPGIRVSKMTLVSVRAEPE